MAKKVEETMAFVNKADNLMSFGKSFATLNGQPLDKSSIFDSKEKAEAYAKSASAYVGKIIVVAEGTKGQEVVTAYVINSDNTLKAIGDKGTMDDLASKITALQKEDTAINGRIDAIDEANTTRDSKIAGLEDNFTGDDANNALSLGGHVAADYQLASELKALAKKDEVAEDDLEATLAKKINDKSDKSYVDEQLKLKATTEALKTTDAKAEQNKTDIATANGNIKTINDNYLKTIAFDEATSKFTFIINEAGVATSKEVDLNLASVIKSFDYDAETKELVLKDAEWTQEKPEGHETRVSVSALIDTYTGTNGTTIKVDVAKNAISAEVKDGSIDAAKLAEAVNTEIAKGADAQTRVATAESKITALEEKPATGITSTQISNWDNEVGVRAIVEHVDTGLAATKAIADANAEALKTKVEQEAFDTLNDTVTNAETGLVKKVGDLETSKAAQSDLEALQKIVNDEKTGLATKADDTEFQAIKTAVNSVDSGLATKASQSSVDTLANKVNNGETGLDSKASQESLDTLDAAVVKTIKTADATLVTSTNTVTLPTATALKLGLVKGSDAENQIKIISNTDHPEINGTMEVNSLNVKKLVQTEGEELILDGGNAGPKAAAK